MKHATACLECRLHKRKCGQQVRNSRSGCDACEKHNKICSMSWTTIPTRQRLLRSSSTKPPTDNSAFSCIWNESLPTVTSQDVWEFVELYFNYIHDRPHSLFHFTSFRYDFQEKLLPQSLIAAVCALGCRFADQERSRSLASNFLSVSKTLFAQQLEVVSISNIQACILLANSYAAIQDHTSEALYFGIANRMALLLGLHRTSNDDGIILRETKSRIWWSLYMADRWCPPGLGIPREISLPTSTVGLPIDEWRYQSLVVPLVVAPAIEEKGLWAYKITLVELLGLIQDLNLALVQPVLDPLAIVREVCHIGTQLHDWHNSLPDHLVMSDQNLEVFREKGHGGTFVALHLGYHHYSSLLYFQFLDADNMETLQNAEYAARCTEHAISFSRLLQKARWLGDCHVVYLTVAHMTIVSSSILLHSLLFGDEAKVDTARTLLIQNFDALMQLSQYWPCVEHMKKRLSIFQDSCLRSSIKGTHTVDKWMIRFLLEYALPLDEKNTELVSNTKDFCFEGSSSTISYGRQAMLDEMLRGLP